MRAIFLCILTLLCACSSSLTVPLAPTVLAAPPVLSRTEAAADLAAKTVALTVQTDEGKTRAYCSGVWVGADLILTAAHCVDDEDNITYVVYRDVYALGSIDENRIMMTRRAAVSVRDADHDLALLRAEEPPQHSTAALSTKPIQAGTYAQSMGHSIGMFFSYSSGEVAAVRSTPLDDDQAVELYWIQADVPISPGNSGGGLFAEDGSLIGITSASFVRGQLLNIFIHRTHIQDLLK